MKTASRIVPVRPGSSRLFHLFGQDMVKVMYMRFPFARMPTTRGLFLQRYNGSLVIDQSLLLRGILAVKFEETKEQILLLDGSLAHALSISESGKVTALLPRDTAEKVSIN
jgi:hypothetical protein